MPPPFSISLRASRVRSYPDTNFLGADSCTAPFSIMAEMSERITLLLPSYFKVIVAISLCLVFIGKNSKNLNVVACELKIHNSSLFIVHYSLYILRHPLLIRHPLPVAYLHHAAEGESEVADEVAHREVVVVGVDAEPAHAFGAGLPLRESEDVPGHVETEKIVGDGETVYGNVGLVVAKPLSVNLFVIGVFVEDNGGVGGGLVPFQEEMSLMFPLVVADGRLVGVAVLPLVKTTLFHPVFRLPDDLHDFFDVVKRGIEVNGPGGGQEDFGGLPVMDKGIDQLLRVPEFFLLRYFVNGLERNLLAVKVGARIDDVDFVGKLVQVQCWARAHVEHPLVALPVVFHPCGVGALLDRDGRVGLHIGGRESELPSVS